MRRFIFLVACFWGISISIPRGIESQALGAFSEAGYSDSTAADSTAVPQRPKIIKKELDPKEQFRTGLFIMSVVITVMVLTNNFNPD